MEKILLHYSNDLDNSREFPSFWKKQLFTSYQLCVNKKCVLIIRYVPKMRIENEREITILITVPCMTNFMHYQILIHCIFFFCINIIPTETMFNWTCDVPFITQEHSRQKNLLTVCNAWKCILAVIILI